MDESLSHPVADILLHNGKIIVACYDGSLRVYSGSSCLSTIHLPTPITRMCTYFESVLAISMASGLLYVLDSSLALVDVIGGFPEPTVVFKAGQNVVVLCYSQRIYLLKEKMPLLESKSLEKKVYSVEDVQMLSARPHSFEVLKVCEHHKVPTSGTYSDGKIAISFENVLAITDEELNVAYTKEFNCCIDSISFYDDGVLVGLINGKINCENFSDSGESFVFNSHVESRPGKKVFFPNTHLLYKKHLYSSGADGRIIRWDLENKKQVSVVFHGRTPVRKFVLSEDRVLVLLDDILESKSPSRVAYIPLE